jgi:hypothetical protein
LGNICGRENVKISFLSNFRFGKPEKRAFFVLSSEKPHATAPIFLAVSMAKMAYSAS